MFFDWFLARSSTLAKWECPLFLRRHRFFLEKFLSQDIQFDVSDKHLVDDDG